MKKSVIAVITLLVVNLALFGLSASAQSSGTCVGVGVTNPQHKMEVDGVLKATTVIADTINATSLNIGGGASNVMSCDFDGTYVTTIDKYTVTDNVPSYQGQLDYYVVQKTSYQPQVTKVPLNAMSCKNNKIMGICHTMTTQTTGTFPSQVIKFKYPAKADLLDAGLNAGKYTCSFP